MFVYGGGNGAIGRMCAHVHVPMYGCIHLSKSGSYLHVFVLVHHPLCCFSPRYNSEGRVTNITLPTGEVSGFHGNLERWSRVEVEASNRENFVTSTNLSASDTIYTFRQGTASWRIVRCFPFLRGQVGTLVECGRTVEFTHCQNMEALVWCGHVFTGLTSRKDCSLAMMHLPPSSLPQTQGRAAYDSSGGD